MTIYEQYLAQYNKLWQRRIIITNLVAAIIVFIFEIAYYFILTLTGLRDQTTVEYIVSFVFLPALGIFTAWGIGWFIVYKSNTSSKIKSLAAILTTVAICTTAACVHNIFATTLCSFFVPLSISVVFGEKRIINIVGASCVVGEIIAMHAASGDLRGDDPYFLLDCLMLFIVFGISWYATLLLMKNEQEKRNVMDHIWQEQSMLQDKICRDELTATYNMLGLQLFFDGKRKENNSEYLNSSIAFLDIDDFKNVNDTFGHEAGNAAIIHIANCIKKHFPDTACVARYGGDEFVVLLPGISTTQCSVILNKLIKNIAILPIPEMDGGRLSISCGVAYCDFCTPLLDAINNSDKAMYKAKSTGKNRCVMA